MEQDKLQICQSVLDLEDLEVFFHPTEPGRKPLPVLRNGVVKEGSNLTKFGEPVRLVTDETAKGSPYFEFTSLDVRDGSATVTFQYRVEGIQGKAELRREGGWKVTSHEIVEQ